LSARKYTVSYRIVSYRIVSYRNYTLSGFKSFTILVAECDLFYENYIWFFYTWWRQWFSCLW